MYRSILVPLDGSALAEQALPLAAEISCRAGATLRLVHVVESADRDLFDSDGLPGLDQSPHPPDTGPMHAYLDRTGASLADRPGLRIDTAVLPCAHGGVRSGTVAQTLADRIVANGGDLVVMTTHGRGGLARLWLGSVADQLVRQSTVPIILLRPRADEPPAALPECWRILIPLDGSALAERVLEHALVFGQLFRAEYTLLHVTSPFILAPPLIADVHGNIPEPEDRIEMVRRRGEAAERYLSDLAERLAAEGHDVATRVVCARQSAAGILEDARAHATDLVALATHGRAGMARLMIGSVADKVLRGAETPLLLYRPPLDDTR